MTYLAGYGSLIHPNETKRHLFTPTCVVPVKIFGFQRVFNQQVTFRKTDGNRAAVLNIQPKRDSWINAILLGGFEEGHYDELDKRESGYNRTLITKENICGYKNIELQDGDKIFIYVGKSGAQNNEILPIKEYLELCLRGAKSYTKEFYEDFIDTTLVNQNIILRDFLATK